MKFAIKPIRHYPPHLRHVAALPREIKNTNFCRYSADMEENANKLHFKCTYFNCLHFLTHLLDICRKFELLTSQGSVATYVR